MCIYIFRLTSFQEVISISRKSKIDDTSLCVFMIIGPEPLPVLSVVLVLVLLHVKLKL